MKRYIEEKLNPVVIPKERNKEPSAVLTQAEMTMPRGAAGGLLWVAKECRPDVGGSAAMSMSWPKDGHTIAHQFANKTIRELKQRLLPINFNDGMDLCERPTMTPSHRVASFWPTRRRRSCMSVVCWRSARVKRVVKATLGLEARVMTTAGGENKSG